MTIQTALNIRCGLLFSLLLLLVFSTDAAFAAATTAKDAEEAFKTWRKRNARPLGTALSAQVKNVQPFKDDAGATIYYLVNLVPSGFVLVAPDDELEPIIAFSEKGPYDASPHSPLCMLVTKDMTARVHTVQKLRVAGGAPTEKQKAALQHAKQKWAALATDESGTLGSMPSISDVRVAPLTQTLWSQSTDNSGAGLCYNYYTPNNYVCGCVATAMAQLMRYYTAAHN